ncbi:MAG: hypothetical protein ACFE9T_00805 [Promethearchaeota archaeon]
MSEQMCRFCHNYVKIAYYCQECGTSCCSDCLHENKFEFLICQDCKSKNIEILDSEKKKICKDCGKENIVKVNQVLKSCPKCNSHQIINIYEKKEELEKKFLETIKDIRLFINPINEILNKLYKIRQKIYKARDPPIKCYQFPKMESDLLALFKLFIYVKNTVYEKINHHLHHLDQNKEYFFDIYSQPNSNLTIFEGLLENLLRNYNSIKEFITTNVKTFNESVVPFEKNLQFIDKINLYFTTYKKFLSLAENEKPVYAIYAKLVNGLNTQDKFKKNKGILFITNLDLSFVHKYGVGKKKQELIFKAPVQDLIRIKEKGKIFKKLYLEFEYGKYEFTFPPNAISRVIEYILLARTFDESTIIDNESTKKLQRIDIELNDLINFIDTSINSFISLKCQYNKGYEKFNNYNNFLTQKVNYQGSPILYKPNQNPPQNIYHPNLNLSQLWPNQQFLANIKNNIIPESLKIYPDFNYPPYIRTPVDQFPNDLNPLQHYLSSNQNINDFFIQDLHNPNRFQNYRPQRLNLYSNDISDYEQKNLLMRKLGQTQKFNYLPPDQANFINSPSINNISNPILDNHLNFHRDEPYFQDYRRNHLSDLFDPDNLLMENTYKSNKKIFKLDKEKRNRLFELDKEKYSLNETLKTLDAKFDQGVISEVDYFRTFKNLQKEIYLIEKKIESLREELEEIEAIKKNSRNFEKKRYFT